MRASRYITHSYKLVDALEKAANANSTASKIYFGTSWGTIPSPVGGYDKETSVQAVMIETNKQSQEIAVALLKGWYPLDPARTANPPELQIRHEPRQYQSTRKPSGAGKPIHPHGETGNFQSGYQRRANLLSSRSQHALQRWTIHFSTRQIAANEDSNSQR